MCMCVSVHVCVRVCVHVCVYVCVYMCVYVYVYMYVYTCVCTCVCTCTCVRVCVHVCVRVCVCMAICIMFNTGEKIFPIVWEVTEALELFDIQVVSLTSDGAKSNRRFYQLCQKEVKKGSIPHKTTNPFRADTQLYFFCDAPHLLKTTRNCFSNSFAHSKSRRLMVRV